MAKHLKPWDQYVQDAQREPVVLPVGPGDELTIQMPSGGAVRRMGRALAANDYCLDRAGSLEIKVQPFGDDEFLPYGLRARADDGWPHTVYRFSCVKQATRAETVATVERVRKAAVLLAEVIGGVLLDADGFPVSGATD